MLGKRRRRWPNINPILGEHLYKMITIEVRHLSVVHLFFWEDERAFLVTVISSCDSLSATYR